MANYFLKESATNNIAVSTADFSNLECENLTVYNDIVCENNARVDGSLNVTGSFYCSILNTTNFSIDELLVGSNIYMGTGGQVFYDNNLLVNSNGMINYNRMYGDLAITTDLVTNSNFYLDKSLYHPRIVEITDSNGSNVNQDELIEIIDEDGYIDFSNIKGTAYTMSNGNKVNVLQAIQAAGTVAGSLFQGVQTGISVLDKVKSFFSDGAKTAVDAASVGEQAANDLTKSASDPTASNKIFVSFTYNVIDIPFYVSPNIAAFTQDVVISEASFLKSGNSGGFSFESNNLYFNGSTQNVIDIGNRIYYANKVDFSNITFDKTGITRSNGNNTFSVFGATFNNSNIFTNSVTTNNINVPLIVTSSNLLMSSVGAMNLNSQSNLFVAGLSNTITCSNFSLSTPKGGLDVTPSVVSLNGSNTAVQLSKEGIGLFAGQNVLAFSSNGNINGVSSIRINSNINSPSVITSNQDVYVTGNLVVSGVVKTKYISMSETFPVTSNMLPGIYGKNATLMFDSEQNQLIFNDAVDTSSLASGNIKSNRPIYDSRFMKPSTVNPFQF